MAPADAESVNANPGETSKKNQHTARHKKTTGRQMVFPSFSITQLLFFRVIDFGFWLADS